jgi:hypothetical protein
VLRDHISVKWPITQVVDPNQTHIHLPKSICDLPEQAQIDYANALGFRCKYNLSDVADRNFLYHGGRIYSIDEESVKVGFVLKNELSTKRKEELRQVLPIIRAKMHPKLYACLRF